VEALWNEVHFDSQRVKQLELNVMMTLKGRPAKATAFCHSFGG